MKKTTLYRTLEDLELEYQDAINMREHFTRALDQMLNREDRNAASQEDVDRVMQQRAHYANNVNQCKAALDKYKADIETQNLADSKPKSPVTLKDYLKPKQKKRGRK